MRRTPLILVALVSVLALAPSAGSMLLAPSAGSTPGSGLRGKVTIAPAFPVCIEEEPCSKPARGALLVFQRNGRVAARVTTSQEGTYRVALAPGRYSVTAPRFRRGSGIMPASVRVLRGRFVRVDFEIDSGIQ